MDPSIYAFQALGVALASAPHFQDTFGPTNVLYPVSTVGDVHFVDDSYASVFGHAGTAAQIQQFVDQLDSFEALYTAAGTFGSASNIDLLARGAVYGQMLGIEHESTPIGSHGGGIGNTPGPSGPHAGSPGGLSGNVIGSQHGPHGGGIGNTQGGTQGGGDGNTQGGTQGGGKRLYRSSRLNTNRRTFVLNPEHLSVDGAPRYQINIARTPKRTRCGVERLEIV
jgi:hypothetical protein